MSARWSSSATSSIPVRTTSSGIVFWNDPFRYLCRLKLFAGVIEPDFSTCLDFPVALKAYSVYRNQALGSFLQRNGILCVPNLTATTSAGPAGPRKDRSTSTAILGSAI